MFTNFKPKPFFKGLLAASILFLLLLMLENNSLKLHPVFSDPNTVCVPIIMYHQIKENNLGKDVITPYEFESDLIYLSENNYSTITMTQVIEYVHGNGDLPKNPIMITFDDGYLTTYKYVYPLLKKYDMKIVLSLIGKDTDNFSKVSDNNINYAYMTWTQINEMIDSGNAEIQNHSYNLHSMNNNRVGCAQIDGETLEDYEKIVIDDIGSFQNHITSMTNTTPNTFTYPFGACSENTDFILKKLGFKATLSCKYGVNLISKEPDTLFGLKRICRSHGNNVSKMIQEGLETLKYTQKQ